MIQQSGEESAGLIRFLLEQRSRLLKHLFQKEPEKSVDTMLLLIKLIIEQNNMSLFEMALEIVGDLYLCCRDASNAVNMYTIQKALGDYSGNYEYKLRAFQNLASLCKGR